LHQPTVYTQKVAVLRGLNVSNILKQSKAHLLLVALLFFCVGNIWASKPIIKFDSLSTTRVWQISHVLPGFGQIVNKQYWKIPVFYTGMGSMAYFGYQANLNYRSLRTQLTISGCAPSDPCQLRLDLEQKRVERNLFFTGAAAFYLASVADAVIVHAGNRHSPATATILSAVVPGLGQVYNGNYWKLPIIYGGMATLYYVIDFNNRGYTRFRNAYFIRIDDNPATTDEFDGLLSEEGLKYYVTAYRRNRDLAYIGLAAFYVLNVIDANVDAHLFDWDISDKLALRMQPTFGLPMAASTSNTQPIVGFSGRLTF
jgi:hypothetical protein